MIDGFRSPKSFGNPRPEDERVEDNPTPDKFVPPTDVASTDEQLEEVGKNLTAPQKKRSFGEWLRGLSGKQKALLATLIVVVVAGAAVGSYFLFFTKSTPPPVVVTTKKQQTKETPKPTTVASNLTGLQVDPSLNERPVTAIMIENSESARPQSGLNQAGVVFEAVAEGGITRFLTLWQDTDSDYIGPVRSVRPYYITWLLGFDAAVAHAGGSAEALNDIRAWHVKDLNDNSNYFWRINTREAPHNLYTSTAKLHDYEAAKGYGKAVFTSFARKDKESPVATPTARTIDFNLSSSLYAAHYDYDPTTNSYKRSEGGKPHTDAKTGAQLAPKVVIALIIPQGRQDIYTTYQTIGSGQVFIFQDGVVIPGTWKKDSNGANLVFTDASGAPIKLNPGQTWLTALGDTSRVTYAP